MRFIFFCLFSTFHYGYSAFASTSTCTIEQLSDHPRIFCISHFLSEEECDYIISYAKPEMSRSTVLDEKTNQRKIDPARTSSSMRCVDDHGDAILSEIERRISELISLPESQAENIQIAHYEVGARYTAHYDYFKNPAAEEGGQRIATFLIYLNTPEKGGETRFPRSNISICPIKGHALLFYNVDNEGFVDPLTLHTGSAVIEGEKWIMTRWFREKDFR